jgi:serine/threonine protein phosphatase PrpC
MDNYDVVDGRLRAMAQAIRQGQFHEASEIGGDGLGFESSILSEELSATSVPLAVSKEALSLAGVVSEGGQATVRCGNWCGRPVAIKKAVIREPQDLIRFRKEVCMVAALRHENIVRCVGARMVPPDYMMLMDLFPTSAGSAVHSGNWKPSIQHVLQIGAQISLALDFLHSQPRKIIHRDVKPGNILLKSGDSSFQAHRSAFIKACLTDFGLACFEKDIKEEFSANVSGKSPSGGFYKQSMVGTLEYMAPEILMKKAPASTASDVFALCISIIELLTQVHPYSDCTRDNPLAHTILEMGYSRHELAVAVAAEGLRPSIPDTVPLKLRQLLRAGLHADPCQRPSAAVLAKEFVDLAACCADHGTSSLDLDLLEEQILSQNGNLCAEEEGVEQSDLWRMPDPPAWMLEGESLVNIPIGLFATAGRRGSDNMEDRSLILRQPFGTDRVIIAGIFDGHRGPEASDFVASNFEKLLLHEWSSCSGPSHLLDSALKRAETEFDSFWTTQNAKSSQKRYPGTTAVCMLLCNGVLSVANIGDSRAMLCRNGAPLMLSVDQTADRADERDRIAAMGFGDELHLRDDGHWRIGSVGLSVSRSIGDHDMKNIGIIGQPELSQVEIEPDTDTFAVLASDGIWDTMTGEDIINVVSETVKQPAMCAQRIVMEALSRGSQDNASAIVAFLAPSLWTTFQRL